MTGIESGLSAALAQMIGVAALETVGSIEVLKNFFQPRSKKLWTVVMAPLAIVFCLVYHYLPVWVSAGVLTVCACQICYDVVLQTFKRIVRGVGGGEVKTGDSHTVYDGQPPGVDRG
ncbi:MAG: hypothetical protein LBE74_06825 [Treponema sp.]|jgi:hypothetical protein|nr:hypothetical protein [Treponema sp.]